MKELHTKTLNRWLKRMVWSIWLFNYGKISKIF